MILLEPGLPEPVRQAVAGWLVCEGLNPNQVGWIEVHEGVCRYRYFLHDYKGQKVFDRRTGDVASEECEFTRQFPIPHCVMMLRTP
jgi:hypothetical protein